jgi:preprotein translocase subunit SecG
MAKLLLILAASSAVFYLILAVLSWRKHKTQESESQKTAPNKTQHTFGASFLP